MQCIIKQKYCKKHFNKKHYLAHFFLALVTLRKHKDKKQLATHWKRRWSPGAPPSPVPCTPNSSCTGRGTGGSRTGGCSSGGSGTGGSGTGGCSSGVPAPPHPCLTPQTRRAGEGVSTPEHPTPGAATLLWMFPPRLGMNIYVGALINSQPMSTADANSASIIPCKVTFVVPSLCYPAQHLAQHDMQPVLSCVIIILKCIISIE